MQQKAFGKDGPLVAVIGQGTWPLPDRDALRLGISLGMTHIDTAEMYGEGRSEEIVGEAIRGTPREKLFIVTKVLPHNAHAKGVRRSCERSLKRLGLDFVDCYLLHWRGDVPIEETMAAFERLVDDGLTRSIGVSNFDPWDLNEAAGALATRRLACDQVLYNLAERTVEDHELPWAQTYDCAIVAYTPFGRPPLDTKKKKYGLLGGIAKRHGTSAAAVALAFLTRDRHVFAIPKASRPEHVKANAQAGELELDNEELRAIDAAFPKRRRSGELPSN